MKPLLGIGALVAASAALAACDPAPVPPDEPFLGMLVPAAAPAGEPVELRGAGFGDDPSVTRVLFGGVEAEIDPFLYTDGFVTVAVPELEAGTVAVVVEVDGVVSGALFFTVQATP